MISFHGILMTTIITKIFIFPTVMQSIKSKNGSQGSLIEEKKVVPEIAIPFGTMVLLMITHGLSSLSGVFFPSLIIGLISDYDIWGAVLLSIYYLSSIYLLLSGTLDKENKPEGILLVPFLLLSLVSALLFWGASYVTLMVTDLSSPRVLMVGTTGMWIVMLCNIFGPALLLQKNDVID